MQLQISASYYHPYFKNILRNAFEDKKESTTTSEILLWPPDSGIVRTMAFQET